MANRIISIEVGVSLTKVCEMDFRAKNPKIYKYFSIPTPEGVCDDGYLEENPSFSTELKQAIQFNRMKAKQAVCTITSSKIATREVQIPAVKNNQVQALIEANASDYFPINLSDFELGHLVLGSIKEEDGSSKLKVLVMACHKQLIQGYEKLCESIGLHLVSVDYSGNSVYQIMKNEVKEETEMVIRIDERQSLATIINGQTMAMQRNVVYGIENAVFTMMNNSAFPQKTYEEAFEELKRITCIRLALNESTVIIEKEEDAPEVSEKVSKAMKEITEALAPLIGNIARVLDLYNSKNPDSPIKRIQLIGIGSEISGLSKLFTNELGVKTIICGNVKNITWNQTAGNGSSGRYVSAIGAGVAPIGFINEEKKKSDLDDVNYRNVSILFSILTILLCFVLFFQSFTKYESLSKKKDNLDAQITKYAPAEETFKKYNRVQELYREVISADKKASSRNDGLLELLTNLEKILPYDCEILEFQSDANEVNMTLEVYDIAVSAKLIDNLRNLNVTDVVSSTGIEEVSMSISEYRERLEKLGYLTEAKTDEEIQKAEENLTDDDGNIITSFEDENGQEISISDKKYKVNIIITYFSEYDDNGEEVANE